MGTRSPPSYFGCKNSLYQKLWSKSLGLPLPPFQNVRPFYTKPSSISAKTKCERQNQYVLNSINLALYVHKPNLCLCMFIELNTNKYHMNIAKMRIDHWPIFQLTCIFVCYVYFAYIEMKHKVKDSNAKLQVHTYYSLLHMYSNLLHTHIFLLAYHCSAQIRG